VDGLKPIFWHQGLFLQPQHFQQSDLYHRSLLTPYQQHLQPHFWGVCSMELVKTSLQHRTCEIENGSFLFQDGTSVTLPDNGIVSSRSFDDAWVETDKPFTIYLGLRKLSPHEDNVTTVDNLADVSRIKSRYLTLSNPQDTKDIYKESPVAHVKYLTHVVQIVWETEKDNMDQYLLIPIARVVRDGDGIVYDKTFSPPVVSLNAAPELLARIREIRDEITGRAMQLSGYNTPGKETNKYDATLMRYILALRSLSRYIPRLFHITEDGTSHPWNVYGVLRELIGEISTFTDSVNMLGETGTGERLVPAYNHAESGQCFQAAHTLISHLLNQITVGPQYLVEMVFDGTCYTTPVPPEFFESRYDFYLMVSTQQRFQDAQQSLLTSAKLASRETVQTLVERSLPGVGIINVATPPSELPRRPSTAYVRLDVHDEQWASIERHRDIALLWEDAPEDVSVELVVVRR